tara:strand:+ start:922 stop:1125 length:204 start_codon:yes stop_codon:yes gene_type:complete
MNITLKVDGSHPIKTWCFLVRAVLRRYLGEGSKGSFAFPPQLVDFTAGACQKQTPGLDKMVAVSVVP